MLRKAFLADIGVFRQGIITATLAMFPQIFYAFVSRPRKSTPQKTKHPTNPKTRHIIFATYLNPNKGGYQTVRKKMRCHKNTSDRAHTQRFKRRALEIQNFNEKGS
jgi:hypothetical protein